jgi:hypothetical protein
MAKALPKLSVGIVRHEIALKKGEIHAREGLFD